LYGLFLGAVLALTINLFSIWLWGWLYKRPFSKILGLFLMVIIIIISVLVVYTQYSSPILPSGIDYGSPKIQVAWNNKGVSLSKQANYKDAIICYNKAIGIDPEYSLAWSNKGNALKALHLDAEAEKAFAKARRKI